MAIPEHLTEAINHYLAGTATAAEKAAVNDWYRSLDDETVEVAADEEGLRDQVEARLRSRLMESTGVDMRPATAKPVGIITMRRIAVAASLLIFLSAGLSLFLNRTNSALTAHRSKPDIAPGTDKAVLTLANGKQIMLDSAKNGIVADEGGTQVKKAGSGQLAYAANAAANAPLMYNTLATPYGGKHKLVLPDGSKVWLNAGSSLTFPTAFNGPVRKVKLTGQALFEVSHDSEHKFIVETAQGDIQDLGTRFNVMAYTDEPEFKTTLLEGSVALHHAGSKAVTLKPGQQAVIKTGGRVATDEDAVRVIDADTGEAIAWTNNTFQCKNTEISTFLRELARWYNVDVKYNGAVPSDRITGFLSRNVNLSRAVNMIEKVTDLQLSVEGRTLTVSRK